MSRWLFRLRVLMVGWCLSFLVWGLVVGLWWEVVIQAAVLVYFLLDGPDRFARWFLRRSPRAS